MSALDKYLNNLSSPVAPGTGCHSWMMSTANLGVFAGKQVSDIFSDIRRSIPSGKRRVSDKEIQEAVEKAARDHSGGRNVSYKPRPKVTPIIKPTITFESIAAQGKYSTERELVDASPIAIPEAPRDQQKFFFEKMFAEDDFIFTGDSLQPGTDRTILPACEWSMVGSSGSLVIVNPLSGCPAPKKSGVGMTYRGDGNVKHFRYCLVEFDNRTIEEQVKFWSAIKLLVKALVHSGSKSIHAWIDVETLNISTLEQWAKLVKIELYERRLKPWGVDMACSNPARMSRLPGVFRAEENQWQRLLWIAERGQNV